MIQFNSSYSRSVLLQLFAILAVLIVIMLFNSDFLIRLYLKNQATSTGYIVNSAIIALFGLGLFRIVTLLLRYSMEEAALKKFLRNVANEQVRPIEDINQRSLIARRYHSVVEISRQNVAVNHSALASTMLATESTRLSLPRFISNILILTGVFGTIVSLSIALLGASNIIDSADGIGSMSMVIHGMSTALSTTTSAIVCYLVFGYLYLKLTDVQTQLLSGIEQATSLYILPRYTYQTDSMLHELGMLVKSLRAAADTMAGTQANYAEVGRKLHAMTDNYADRMNRLSADIEDIKHLLAQGFRLPE